MSAHDSPGAPGGSGSESTPDATAHVIPAAVTAAGVALALLVGVMLGVLSSLVASSWYGYGGGANSLGFVAAQLLQVGNSLLTLVLPVSLGVFGAFAKLVPLRGSFRLAQVIGRSLVAAASGIALSVVFSLVFVGVGALRALGPLFGDSFPGGSASGWDILSSLIGVVGSAFSSLDSVVPLVVLAGVLLWLWLGRRPVAEATRAEPDGV